MHKYSETGGTTVFRVTIPAQRLTTSSNYVALTGTTGIKLRGTSDMVTEEGKIHNYRMDYKKQITILDYTPGGTTTGAGLYNTGSNCTVSASVKPGYEFAGWYEGEGLYPVPHNTALRCLRTVPSSPNTGITDPGELP